MDAEHTYRRRRTRPDGNRLQPKVALALLVLVLGLSVLAVIPAPGTLPPESGHGFNPTTFAAPTLSTSSNGTCVSKSTFTSASLGTVAASSTVVVFVEMAQA